MKTKILSILLIVLLCNTICLAQKPDKAQIFNTHDMNNESLYFQGENNKDGDMQHYSISKSFIKQFDGYKTLFPELEFLEVSYVGPQFNDKNYSLNWVAIDSVLYLARLKGICIPNDSILKKINGHKIIEDLVGRKFDVPYKMNNYSKNAIEPPISETSWVSSYKPFVEPIIMKADWINGDYFVYRFSGEYPVSKNNNTFKLSIKNGKIISKEQIVD